MFKTIKNFYKSFHQALASLLQGKTNAIYEKDYLKFYTSKLCVLETKSEGEVIQRVKCTLFLSFKFESLLLHQFSEHIFVTILFTPEKNRANKFNVQKFPIWYVLDNFYFINTKHLMSVLDVLISGFMQLNYNSILIFFN